MPGNKRQSKARRYLGNALIVTGALLLAGFALAKGWSVAQSRSGIEAFEAGRAAVQAAPSFPADVEYQPDTAVRRTQVDTSAARLAAREAPDAAWYSEPDFSLWSEKRISDFEKSLKADGDAPHAVLNIDHLNIRVPVYNGADEFNLNRGVARIIGTGRVGEGGNLGIAGHRDGFFRPLKDIEVGDTIELETWYGTEIYTVSSIDIVDPSQVSVLAPTDRSTVTLVTCYPFYYVGHAPKRFIVKGEAHDHQVDS